MSRGGPLMQSMGTPLVVPTVYSQLHCLPLFMFQRIFYGGRMFLWRFWCSLGACFTTDCLLKQIYFAKALYLLKRNCVLHVAAYMSLNVIYFCLVIFSVNFGSLLGTGFVFIQRIQLIFWIILFSLVPLQALVHLDALLCTWYGLLQLG